MNKLKLIILTFLFLPQINFAQESLNSNSKFYISTKVGYTLPAASTTVGSPREEVGREFLYIRNNGNDINEFSQQSSTGSRGAGFTTAFSLGYMFNKNIGVEMEISYLRSTTREDARLDVDTSQNQDTRYFAEQYSYTSMFRLAPMLVIQADGNSKFQPYAKLGILMPFAGSTNIKLSIDDQTGARAMDLLPVINPDSEERMIEQIGVAVPIPAPTASEIEAKTYGALSIGFASRVGANYQINDKWKIFGELEVNLLSIKADRTVFTSFESRITSQEFIDAANAFGLNTSYTIDDIPEIIRVTQYVDEVTQNSNSTFDTKSPSYDRDKPLERKNFRDNYSSWGFFLGIKYAF